MSINHSIPSKRVLQIIDLLDSKPEKSKPVLFRFISDEEGSLYRLAALLKREGYCIEFTRHRAGHCWLCIASGSLGPKDDPLDRLCIRMLELADQYRVIFDGWETKIEGNEANADQANDIG